MDELTFYKRRNKEKSEALRQIEQICLLIGGRENMYDIAQDALDYIVALEKKLEECHPRGKDYKDDADVRDLSNKYWGHVK